MVLRRLPLACILVLCCILPTSGQADSGIPVHDGLWGLELGISGLSGSTNMLGVAVKHHVGNRSAIRAGFSGIVNSSDVDDTMREEYITSDTSVSVPNSQVDGSTDRRDVTVFAHWVQYHGLDEHFGMTLEAGPSVHWYSTEYSEQFAYPGSPDQNYLYQEDVNLWEYGLDLQMGFEWFFTEHVSLGARYGIAALRTDESRTRTNFSSSIYDGIMRHDYSEIHSDGFVVRTILPSVSLTASW